METFTQPKITGYRQLSEREASMINAIKHQASQVEMLVLELEQQTPEMDLRWINIARTQLQVGFMALTRAVAKPTSF